MALSLSAGAALAQPPHPGDARLAARIDQILRGRGSPLAGYGRTFVAAGRRYHINPSLLLGISAVESTYGRAMCNHNPFGWQPYCGFDSFAEAIWSVTRGLRLHYVNGGRVTLLEVGLKYNPVNPYAWSRKVGSHMGQFGNGLDVVW